MASTSKNPSDSTDSEEQKPQKPKPKNDPEAPACQPEIDNPEMLIKRHCECDKCTHWSISTGWSAPKSESKNPHKNVNRERIQPLLKSAKHPSQPPKIFPYNPGKLTRVEKLGFLKTVVHGEMVPHPVKMLSDTYFSEDIQSALERLNYKYSLPIQSFVWPAVFKQLNVCLIGGPKSGKTMSYLPAICTFCKTEEKKFEELSKYKGPLVLIICPNSKQCEDVFDLTKKLFENIPTRPKVATVTYPVTYINNVDIAITIPNTLIHCLKERFFNLKKVCYLVLEDTSLLLKDHEEAIYKVLKVVDEMLEHRVINAKVQLIATSTKWTSDLQKLLKFINSTPMVCIGNHLEAALYGNVEFNIKFLMAELKKQYVEEILKDKYHLFKTIVICNNDEITNLNKWLVRNGIEVMALSDKSTKEEIEHCEEEWGYLRGGQYKVLLCTDFIFDTMLCISDAMWLVNYSFSSTWTRFTKRFSAFTQHYRSPLGTNQDGVKCKCFLLADENCEKQMLKFLNLLNRLSKDLPPKWQTYAEGFKHQNEINKIDLGIELCNTLKLFGKCSDLLCEKRHVVREEVDVSERLPKSGKIVFKILSFKDVTQYSVQLLRSIDLDGNVNEINNDDLRNPLVFKSEDEKIQAKNIQIGKFYAHCDYTTEKEEFTLCELLSFGKDNFVEVKLSNGVTLQTMQKMLYQLPSHLKIVDVFLSNFIPPFKDEMFSFRSFYITQNSLQTMKYKKMELTGDIYLQLDKTFWLDNVAQILKVDGCDIIKFNLTKHLMNLHVVDVSKDQITQLHKLCEGCDIVLPCYVKNKAKKAVKIKEVEPQRAFLDDNVHEVILNSAVSPAEFYVRLAKFQPLLENLEKEIQDAVEKEIPDKDLNVEVGKYYLALDPRTASYARVSILSIENSTAWCYFVDYGDEALVEVANLKLLPSKFLTRLPFQAIQCRLFGVSPAFSEWKDEATDILYKYMFEPDSDIYRPLYVQVMGKDDCKTIRAKTTYSVLMKDGFDENETLINQLLLDCGFATSLFEKIVDFEIPKLEVVESDSEWEVDESNSKSEINDLNKNVVERNVNDILGEDFDLEIFDAVEMLKFFGCAVQDDESLKEQENSEKVYENEAEQENCEKVDEGKTITKNSEICGELNVCTPEVYWSQTDKTIKIKVKLIGVKEYKTTVLQKRFLTFNTFHDGKDYRLKLILHKSVTMAKHRAGGLEVEIVLNKIEAVEWHQLTATTERLRFVHYEVTNLKEEPKRRFLQFDFSDDDDNEESDDNDVTKPVIYEVSDMDSEFDEENVSSSSD